MLHEQFTSAYVLSFILFILFCSLLLIFLALLKHFFLHTSSHKGMLRFLDYVHSARNTDIISQTYLLTQNTILH